MSQNASLFSVEKANFKELQENPGTKDPGQLCNEHVTFHQTHEGLQYVLSKGLTEEMLDLVAELFYPIRSYGNTVELETIDTISIDDDIYTGEPIFFHAPGKVVQLNTLLQAIDEESFRANFDADELNSEDVYPGTWNSEVTGRSAFNEIHLLEDFEKLKLFFAKASAEGCYVLVFL
jgi:hypothetical protein